MKVANYLTHFSNIFSIEIITVLGLVVTFKGYETNQSRKLTEHCFGSTLIRFKILDLRMLVHKNF